MTYGKIRVTGGLLVVLGLAFFATTHTAFAAANLLTNPGAETNDFTGWTKVDGGNGWGITGFAHSGTHAFISSYFDGTLSQEINLSSAGYSNGTMDAQPQINASTYVAGYDSFSGTDDPYQVLVELRDASHAVITSYDTGSQTANGSWTHISHSFTGYGTGVRYIYFKLTGRSSAFWAGQYGATFDDSSVTIGIDSSLSYAAGANGSLTGTTSQTVNINADGTAVTAVPNAGYSFINWSDALTANPRTDTSVWVDNSVTANFADATAPVISVVVAAPSQTTVLVTWTTDELASSMVEYGPTTGYGTATPEIDTSPRVTSHAVTISSLSKCATYHFRTKSNDSLTNLATGSDATFKTKGCGRPEWHDINAIPSQDAPSVAPVTTSPVVTATDTPVIATTGNDPVISGTEVTAAPEATIPAVDQAKLTFFTFTTDMRVGQQSNDVARLQQFLKEQGSDMYPEGIVSGYFGRLTRFAVIRFQEKYAADILTPLNKKTGTGFVGPSTRAKINALISG